MNGKPAENYRAPFLEDLRALIRIPSRSFPGGGEEGEIQRLVARKMRAAGARVRTVGVGDVPGCLEHPLWCGPERDYRDRPTVVGEMGPENGPALAVMAHSDTVPLFEPGRWTVDPFGGEIKNGSVYGLGAGDDKWGLACLLTVMRVLAGRGRAPGKRLVFISTVDEENGVGNGLLLPMLAGIRAGAALYLDGGQMQVTIGNPGGSNLYLRPVPGAGPRLMDRHAALLADACAAESRARVPLFDQPYFRDCRDAGKSVLLYRRADSRGPFFLVAFYMPPGETREAVVARLERMVADALGADAAAYERSWRDPWFEPSLVPAETPLAVMLGRAVRLETGRAPAVAVGGKQDSFVFRNHARIPTVSFGVSRVGAGGFHQPDENVSVADAWAGCRVVSRVVGRWLEGSC